MDTRHYRTATASNVPLLKKTIKNISQTYFKCILFKEFQGISSSATHSLPQVQVTYRNATYLRNFIS